jgi:hypothetical protein
MFNEHDSRIALNWESPKPIATPEITHRRLRNVATVV